MKNSRGLLTTLIILFVIIILIGGGILFFYLQPRTTTITLIYEKDVTEPVLVSKAVETPEVEDINWCDACSVCNSCFNYDWQCTYCYDPCEDPCADPCHYPNYYMYDSPYWPYRYYYGSYSYFIDFDHIICHKNYYNCGDFRNQRDAQKVFDFCWDEGYGDIHHLDEDEDYRACESLD